MKLRLRNIQFKGFRSLTDCRLDVDGAVTTVVGENETGKTNVLVAIEKFNKGRNFDPLIDRRQHSRTDPTLALTFDILGEKNELFEILGAKQDDRTKTLVIEKQGDSYSIVTPAPNVEKSKFYIEALEVASVENDEVEGEQEATQESQVPSEEPSEEGASEADDEEEERVEVDHDEISKKIVDWILSKVDIKYFKGRDTTELIKGQIGLRALQTSPDKNSQMIKLLSIGGINPEDFPTDPGQQHFLKKASTEITERIKKFWKQEDIEVEISYSAPNVIIKVKDGKIDGDVWLSPEQRSDGFQWYFAFYVHFLGELESKITDSLLLLDEPGIFLHADGQQNLLELFEEITKNGNQIIYTTHSPFMIHRDYIDRVRFIQKKGKGSVIDNSAWSRGGQGTLPEPVRATVGMLLSDSLLYGKKNLVVEGPSDKIYIRDISNMLASAGKKEIINFKEVSVLPAYSATKIPTTVQFLKNEALTVLAVADSDGSGNSALAQLITKKVLTDDEIIKLKDIAGGGSPRESIEDFVPKKFFLSAVNEVYAELYDDWQEIKENDLSGGYYPVVPKIQEVLKKRQIDTELEKVKIAQRVIENCEVKQIINDKREIADEWKKMVDLISAIHNKVK